MKNAVRTSIRVDDGFDPAWPYVVEYHAIDGRENIDSERLAPETDEFARTYKIVGRDIGKRRAKRLKRFKDSVDIFQIPLHEKIETFRCARLRMKSHRVPADDQIFNAV